jgi:two-component system, chemotaxis family, chemotaxis protein CheY
MVERLNFTELSALVVDSDRFSTGIITQILRGFGLSHHIVVDTGEEAQKQLSGGRFDILICECVLPDMKGAELVRWVRRQSESKLRTMTIVVLSGYTHFSNVTDARDAGANSVVRKPVAPIVLFDHIAWSAKTERPFIEADNYSGPCRRFKFGEPTTEHSRRVSDHYQTPTPAIEIPPTEEGAN